MNWQQKKKLQEERGKLIGDMQALLKKANDETRDMSAEEQTSFDTMHTRAEAIKGQLDRYDAFERLSAQGAEQRQQQPGRDDVNTPEQQADEAAKEYRSQFGQWLRGTNPVELRALSVSGAGVVGDRPFLDKIIASMKSFAGVIEAGAEVIPTTTGNPLGIPTADDTSNVGVLVGEATTSDDDADPDLGALSLGAYKFDSRWVKVSLELLRDAAYDVEGFVTRTAAERIGRAFNGYSTTGTGTGQPKGFVTGAGTGKVCAATNAVTYEEFVDFQHSLDAAYRNSGRCKIQLHDLTLAALRKLKDTSGRYIWSAGTSGLPASLDGYGYVVNNDMAHVGSGAGSAIAAIGDWSRYIVRVVAMPELIRANELFISDGLVGFKVFQRIDGKLADAKAVKLLKLAAA